MTNKVLMLITFVLICGFIIIIELLMPKLTRKELFFGIRIPEKEINHPTLRQIYKKYVLLTLSLSIPITAILILIIYLTNSVALFSLGLIATIFIQYIFYYLSHKKVKMLKLSEHWNEQNEEVVIIDTGYTGSKRSKLIASQWWFLVSLLIIAFNIFIILANYDALPNRIPIHWGIDGTPDQWIDKTFSSIFYMPILQLFLVGILFFAYKSIAWAKQQISATNPEESLEKSRIFRLRWSRFIVGVLLILQIMFTYLNLTSFGLIDSNSVIMSVLPFVITITIILTVIVLALRTGQGGSRLKIKFRSSMEKSFDRDDDKNWKLGLFYFNPDDPSIFIEKRFGIGFTINFGNFTALLILLVLIIAIGLMALLPKVLS